MGVGVSRRCAGPARDKRRIPRDQFSRRRVQPEYERLIEAFVRDDDVAATAIEGTRVRMRFGLLCAMRSRLSLELREIAQWSKRAVAIDRKDDQTAARVIRQREITSRRVDGDVDPV